MKRVNILLLFLLPLFAKAQSYQSLDTVKAPAIYENVYSRAIDSDSLVSSFVIFIKKEVKKHKHVSHSEHVYVLEGEGEMLLGEKSFKIKKGDVLFIPKNTIHALKVTSVSPMKVVSVQAPFFDGKDRIFID
ncbi:MAG: cupin domain-containing protein [Bacteroidota bacterium]